MFFLCILCTLITAGCIQPSLQKENYGVEIHFTDLDLELCINSYSIRDSGKTEFVINSNEEYLALMDNKSSADFCNNYTLPEVNFTQYTLLGKYTEGVGCSIEFVRKVYVNDTNKTITYIIDVVEDGNCKKMGMSMNWILIPRVAPNFTIQFKVE